MKKEIILIFTFLISVNIYSQRKNYSNRNRSTNPITKINPKNMVQILEYNVEKVIKKLKIKKTQKKEKVDKVISIHNKSIKKIETTNQDTFDNIIIFYTGKISETKLKKDNNILKKAKVKVIKLLLPIRKEVVFQKKKLNNSLKEILSDKQYNKWLKYQKKKITNLKSSKTKRRKLGFKTEKKVYRSINSY